MKIFADIVSQEFAVLMLSITGFAFATSASPGPVNIVSAMSGAKFGAARSVPYVMGATIGFVAILLFAGSGLFITRYPLLAKSLAIASALYMLYLAYAIASAATQKLSGDETEAPPCLLDGLVAQFIRAC